MNYQLTTLPNGLRVATEFLPGVETVAMAVSVGVGARYESEPENGLSHLLEHMAFKGTDTRTAREIAESFDHIGGQFNAYTSMDMTVYHAKLLKHDTEFGFSILADILRHSVFAEEELVKEKDVVLQEIGMHMDSPEDLLTDYFDDTLYPGQPLGRSILGTPERIAVLNRGHIIDYMRRHYVPTRIVVTAAGAIDHEQFVAVVKRHFDLAPAGQAPAADSAHYVGGEVSIAADFEQLHVALGFPAVSVHDPRYYGLQLYSGILGGGMSSRLFQEVREERGLAYSVYASGSAYQDVGVMGIYAATAPEKASELTNTLADEVKRMADGVSEPELTRVKNQTKAELLMARESSQTVAGWMGRHLLFYNEYRELPTIFAKIDAVSLNDIKAMAELIASGKRTLVMLGKLNS